MIAKRSARQCLSRRRRARERLPFDKANRISAPTAVRTTAAGGAGPAWGPRAGDHEGPTGARDFSGIGRRRPSDRGCRSAPRRRIDRAGVPRGRRRGSPVMVRSLFRPGTGCVDTGAARDHLVQPELAESDGLRWRGLPGESRGGRGLALLGFMAPPSEAWPDVESGRIRGLDRPRSARSLEFPNPLTG